MRLAYLHVRSLAGMARLLAAALLSALPAWTIVAAPEPPAAGRPNIVFILADDIGYGDLSCYGARLVQTPNLDRLAREGCRFTDAHSAASTCTPSRRALLTGRYSWRQEPGAGILPGDAPLSIPPGTPTLPSMLRDAGYATGAVGKWHLGLGGETGPDWNRDIKPGPLEIGFDHAFFIPATGDRVPCVYVENHRVVGLDPADPITVSYKSKVGNWPTGRENPELLRLRHTHGHDMTIVNGIGRIGWMTGGKAALWKDQDMSDTLTSKAVSFIANNKTRPFFLYFATHNIHVPRVPHPRHHGRSQCGTRGDAIVELDCAVGEVVAALDRLNLADKTLVVFSSDNGGVMDDGYEDTGNFGHPCNGTLRGYKSSLFEGGHRVPFIARWPSRIRAGTECAELISHIDMMASLAALTGAKLPQGAAADSCNVLPALLGRPHDAPGRSAFIAHRGGVKGPFAARKDNWKLIDGPGGRDNLRQTAAKDRKPTESLYLFDLAADPNEQNNLAAENPGKVRELLDMLARTRRP